MSLKTHLFVETLVLFFGSGRSLSVVVVVSSSSLTFFLYIGFLLMLSTFARRLSSVSRSPFSSSLRAPASRQHFRSSFAVMASSSTFLREVFRERR